jgi:excisionase family DNA binding protein
MLPSPRTERDTLMAPIGTADRGLSSDITNKPTGASPVELLTIPEVARLLKISVPGVRRLQQRRLIPFLKIGGSVRFQKNDLFEYLERRRVNRIG